MTNKQIDKHPKPSFSKILRFSLVFLILFAGFAVAGLLYEHSIMPKESEAACVPMGCGAPNTAYYDMGNAFLCLKDGASISATCRTCIRRGKAGGCKAWTSVVGYARINGGRLQTRVTQVYLNRDSGWVDGTGASSYAVSASSSSGGVRVGRPCTSDWTPW